MNIKTLFLTVFCAVAFISGCVTTRFSGYPSQDMKDRGIAFSDQPLYRVEPSTTTPELWTRVVSKYQVQLKLDPELPVATDKVKIGVTVSDISRNPAMPVSGAKISCKAIMPNTPGYIHWLNNNICYLSETHPGLCEMEPVIFGTGGDWEMMVKIQIPGDKIYSAVFPVEVQGPPWPPNHLP